MPGEGVLQRALSLGRTVAGHAGEEDVGVVVSAGPRVRCGHRCPHCGRRSPPCDSLGRRRRGDLDLGGSTCRAGAEVTGVRCPEHGVVAEAVPWARHHAMFCRASGDQVAQLAPRMRGSAPDGPVCVCGLAHRGRHLLEGRSVARGGRAGGPGPVGTGEASHEGGHRRAAVVAGHDRGRGRPCGGRAQADALPGLPAEGQGKGIEGAAAGAPGGARGRRPTAPSW